MLLFEQPNHFLHFNQLLGKTMPKLLVTYGIMYNKFTICWLKCKNI